MFSSIIDAVVNFAIKYGLYFLIPLALGILGSAVSAVFPSSILTSVFVLFRHLLMIFDFGLDIPLILMLFGYSLKISIAYFVYKGYMAIYKLFTPNLIK